MQQSNTKFMFFALVGFIAGAFAITLAIAYGMFILLFIVAPLAFIFAIRFGVMPIALQAVELVNNSTDVVLKVKTARRYNAIEADENGNYPQMISWDNAQVLSYIAPGNAPTAQVARQNNHYKITEEPEHLQIEAPGAGGINPETVTAPTFREELVTGMMEPGSPFTFGYKIVTDPFTHITKLEPILDAAHKTMFLVGWSGYGKSTLIAGAMARRARVENNVAYLVFDPHKGAEEDSLTCQIMPAFEPWLIQPKGGAKITGRNPKELRAALDFLKREKELRLERDDLTPAQRAELSPYYRLKIWVIVDEVLEYVRESRIPGHDPIYDEFAAMLQSLATATRKGGISGVYMLQLGQKDELGKFELKDACPERVVLTSPKDQGSLLGLTVSESKQCEMFPQGKGYYKSRGGFEQFVWGYGSPEDIAAALADATSPLTQQWKEDGNKIHLLRPEQAQETTWKQDGNKNGNTFPPALQAELDQIEDYPRLLAIMEDNIAETKAVKWRALFDIAPGGRNALQQSKQSKIYDVLTEAVKYKYSRLKAANGER
jgi:hypothetical protein